MVLHCARICFALSIANMAPALLNAQATARRATGQQMAIADTLAAQRERRASNEQLAAGRSGVHAMEGIRYVVLRSGDPRGLRPSRNAAVKLRYEGSFLDGRLFTSTRERPQGAEIFPLAGRIPGLVTIVQQMRRGDVWRVYIPTEYAYPRGDTPVAGQPLIFELELVEHVELPPPPSPVLTELPPSQG